MEIDWFTVGAQVLNFLVLLWLLQRFLYQPILGAMDAREARIADEMTHAQQLRQEAADKVEAYEEKRRAIEQRERALLEDARRDADAQRLALLEDARQEVERVEREWYASLEREQQDVLESVRQRAEESLFNIARRALSDLADDDLNERVIDTGIQRILRADPHDFEDLRPPLGAPAPVCVRSSIPLTQAQQQQLCAALDQLLDRDTSPRFDVVETLQAGLEVRIDGHRFGWSMTQYLDDLQQTLDELLQRRIERAQRAHPPLDTQPEAQNQDEATP